MTFDKTCIWATALFIVSNAIGFVYMVSYRQRNHFDYALFTQLDTAHIQSEWEWRSEHRALEIAGGIINAFAWFFLAIPILQVAWIQSQQQGANMMVVHIAVAALAIGGAIVELVSHLLLIGTTNALEWLSQDFNLGQWVDNSSSGAEDGIGWKTLEVAHIAARGMLLWVGAVELLFLSVIFTLLFISIRAQHDRLFDIRWAYFGTVVAGFCFADFTTELLRFESWRTFSALSGALMFFNRLILFPAWLLLLSAQLPKAMEVAKSKIGTPASGAGSVEASDQPPTLT